MTTVSPVQAEAKSLLLALTRELPLADCWRITEAINDVFDPPREIVPILADIRRLMPTFENVKFECWQGSWFSFCRLAGAAPVNNCNASDPIYCTPSSTPLIHNLICLSKKKKKKEWSMQQELLVCPALSGVPPLDSESSLKHSTVLDHLSHSWFWGFDGSASWEEKWEEQHFIHGASTDKRENNKEQMTTY